ncbi:MAG TPA: MBL fold metallo-hydrolase [Opitutaceae bacterium]|nr:MBL fold metallo-hydrolase [Opitutaceae bacterium]
MSFAPPLEDELGDILDKAMRNAGLTEAQLAAATGIDAGRIKDAEDYRYDFSCIELQKLAIALGLNEVGVCALSQGKYPLPELPELPFRLHTIALPYGIGRVNAFVVEHPATRATLVVDTADCPERLLSAWPQGIANPAAVLLTHWDRDHSGGLPALVHRSPTARVLAPAKRTGFAVESVGEGIERELAGFHVHVFRTPGHTAEHNAYHLSLGDAAPGVLFSGDLIFAGSLGGAFHCCQTLRREARRVVDLLPADTLIAAGHGPFTTIANERRFNPFLG